MSFFIAFIIGAVVLAIFFIGTYNNLVTMRNGCREAWSAIDTELRRRFDLIPNLVETVKGYAAHEHNTLEDVIKARNAAYAPQGNVEQQVESQNMLTQALGRLMAISENYPQLKANENFMALQNELNETETRISQARRFYNANVKEFNTACEQFPGSIIANSCGFRSQPYYGVEDSRAYDPVQISFNSPATNSDKDGAKLRIADKQPESK